MRIVYQGGRLYVSHTKDEIKDIQDNTGNPCEIDLGNIKVLHEDISKVIQERLLEKENWWDKIPHGPSMGD
tara:strand:+ start:135 stop:347 length:213 start_codon:yes stop_codon:yes gene_type:complete